MLATRRGKLLLLLLCAVQFLDVVDSSIMNVALPPSGGEPDLDIGLVLLNVGAMNAPGWQRHASEPLAEVL
jgi:hypothetical protein